MNLSPSQQLAYSRESPLDPRTWDLSERMASQSGISGKNTPDVGPGSGTPPTMPHQVSKAVFQAQSAIYLGMEHSGSETRKFWLIHRPRPSYSLLSRSFLLIFELPAIGT